MKKITSVILLVVAMLSISSTTFAITGGHEPEGFNGDTQTDIAKIFLIKHEMKFDLQGTHATLDGQE